MDPKVSVQSSVRSNTIQTELQISQVVARIASGTDAPQVTAVREARLTLPKNEVQSLKSGTLAAYTPHGTFSLRRDDAMLTSSGLGFLDVDDPCGMSGAEVKERLSRVPSVVAAYDSPSGGGRVHALVALRTGYDTVEGLQEAIAQAVSGAAASAGVSADNVGDLSRACFLSWDPCPFFDRSRILLPDTRVSFGDITSPNTHCHQTIPSHRPLRYSGTVQELDFGGECFLTFPEGTDGFSVFLGNRYEGRRASSLYSALANLLLGNQWAELPLVIARGMYLNTKLVPPLPERQVMSVCQQVFRKHENGGLRTNRTRKIVFRPDCGLSASQKRSIAATEVARMRNQRTLEQLVDAYRAILGQGKVPTQVLVAGATGMSLPTVKRRWTDLLGHEGIVQ